jgi:hypothetical protein
VREKLIYDINNDMTDNERKFLLSFKNKKPDWALLEMNNTELSAALPSVQWRMINLEKMTAARHKQAYKNLEAILFPKSKI